MLMVSTCSCGPPPDLRELAKGDLQPPVLIRVSAESSRELDLVFHEPVTREETEFLIVPTISLSSVSCIADRLRLSLGESMQPGTHYRLEGSVGDASGNTMKFITEFYGFNPQIPDLCINELTTRGSGKHPDVVELFVRSAGNLAGVVVYEGTEEEWTDRLVLPNVNVAAGDYVLIHFRPEGLPEELNELTDRTASGGYDASETAWDFWLPNGNGLTGNNGAVTVCAGVGGPIIDAVLYSDRTSQSDENYRGFGSRRMLGWAEYLAAQSAWVVSEGLIRPEDAVNPDGSTGTRSICRDSKSTDTDSKADWHIVPTRGATFGGENSDEVHEG